MSCTFEPELTAYVDGELPEPLRASLERHLPSCQGCRATLSLLQQAVASLAALPEPEVARSPAALRRQVLERLDASPAPGGLAALWARLSRPVVLMPSFGLVAAAVLAAVLFARADRLPAGLPSGFEADGEPEQLEIAANMEVVEDYELFGLSDEEDLEVVQNLHELEGTP